MKPHRKNIDHICNKKMQTKTNGFECPQLPGTFFRINLKPGFVINIFNTIEISSPAGFCLIFRLLP